MSKMPFLGLRTGPTVLIGLIFPLTLEKIITQLMLSIAGEKEIRKVEKKAALNRLSFSMTSSQVNSIITLLIHCLQSS